MSSEDPASYEHVNIVTLVKGKERYAFLYSDLNRNDCLQTIGRFASDPELSFNWYDAAVCSQGVRVLDAERH